MLFLFILGWFCLVSLKWPYANLHISGDMVCLLIEVSTPYFYINKESHFNFLESAYFSQKIVPPALSESKAGMPTSPLAPPTTSNSHPFCLPLTTYYEAMCMPQTPNYFCTRCSPYNAVIPGTQPSVSKLEVPGHQRRAPRSQAAPAPLLSGWGARCEFAGTGQTPESPLH